MAAHVAASTVASLHSNIGATSRLLGFNSTAISFQTDLSLKLNFSALFPSIDGFYGAMKVCNSGRNSGWKTVVRSKSGGVAQDDIALSLLQPGQSLEAASRSLRPAALTTETIPLQSLRVIIVSKNRKPFAMFYDSIGVCRVHYIIV